MRVLTRHELLSEYEDATLLDLARSGDAAASDVLWVRTWPAALAVARFVVDNKSDAEDLASEAMTSVFSAIGRGVGPTDVIRAYVATTIRNLHNTAMRRQSRVGKSLDLGDERVLRLVADGPDATESAMVGRAFRGLPDRWRVVLWATLVEGKNGDEVATDLGINAAAVYALKARALEALRQRYLTEHALQGRDQDCAFVHRSLAATVRGRNRRAAEEQQVWLHLRSCAHCAEGYREMTAINTKLGALVGPVVGGLALLGAESAHWGAFEGIRLASAGAKLGMAAAAVAGVVAVSTAAVNLAAPSPDPAPVAASTRTTPQTAPVVPAVADRPTPRSPVREKTRPNARPSGPAAPTAQPTCVGGKNVLPAGALPGLPGIEVPALPLGPGCRSALTGGIALPASLADVLPTGVRGLLAKPGKHVKPGAVLPGLGAAVGGPAPLLAPAPDLLDGVPGLAAR